MYKNILTCVNLEGSIVIMKISQLIKICASFILFFQCDCFAYIEKTMVVIIPSYNNEQWVEKNLKSVLSQKYENFKVLYVDDCSTDNTYKKVLDLVETLHEQERVTIIHNKERVGAMANWYRAIHMCDDKAVIVQLDGDDWLAHEGVLPYLNKIYSESDIWLTYGQFAEYPTGTRHDEYSKPFTQQVIANNSFRKVEQLPMSHLRTGYAWLFKSIKLEDVLYQGNFYPMTCDKVMLACCVEMAARHHFCVPDVLYIYNNTNQLSDHRVDWRLQWTIARHVLELPPYAQLDTAKKVDEIETDDYTSVILFSSQKPSLQMVKNIALCKVKYHDIEIMYPDTTCDAIIENDGIRLVPYSDSNFVDQFKNIIRQLNSNYVQLSTHEESLFTDTAVCVRFLKKTQVDLLLQVNLRDNKIQQLLNQNKLPKISITYDAYALYPQSYSLQLLCDMTDICIVRKDLLVSLQTFEEAGDFVALQHILMQYIHQNNILAVLLNL